MSCRETPTGSLATTFIPQSHGLRDSMATNLFHELRTHAARTGATVDRATFDAAVTEMEQRIRTDPAWDPTLRARALARIDAVRAGDMPDQPIAVALTELGRRADRARDALERRWSFYAAVFGVPEAVAEAEFWRLRRSHAQLPAEARRRTLDPDVADIPNDPATRYAVAAFAAGLRCGTCGQFLGRSQGHTCPPPARRPLAPAAPAAAPAQSAAVSVQQGDEDDTAFRVAYEDFREPQTEFPDAFSHGEDPAQPEPAAPADPYMGAGVEPVAMEDFQSAYDAAIARFADGDTAIPAWTDPVPGEVTGGLGARDGGNSFGIELELDFPDDTYPYTARNEFARRLHAEGIVTQPYVMNWHFIGDNRPGGTFSDDPDGWICEFDRSVDTANGQRGVEIKSQILYDEPRTWHNLARITAIAAELGGQATVRTGLHVNVGGAGFDPSDPAAHNALLRLAAAYDDTIVRLAHNPDSGPNHRGRNYCGYADVPADGYRSVADARARSNHYQAFNLGHLPAEGETHTGSSRVEVRVWDSTVDVGRIQAAVTLSLALNKLAVDGAAPGQGPEPSGTHRGTYGRRKLAGPQWEASTESFRRLAALVASAGAFSDRHLSQLTTMFAASRWQAR